MTGVEILDTFTVETALPIELFIMRIVFTFAVVFVMCLCANCTTLFSFIVALIAAASVALASLPITSKNPEKETRYEVIVSDEVNFNEFNEKYEILDQDGKIYTVRERVE